MSNPQLENGYIKVATEIWENLIKYRISGEEMKCLMFVIRKTYGWNKKQDDISLSQFVDATEMAKSSVCRAINNLKNKNMIFVYKKVNKKHSTYEFNKKYIEWKTFTKRLIVYKKVNNRLQKSKSAFTKMRHTIDTNTIDNTKDICPYQKIVDAFNQTLFGLPSVQLLTDSRKTNLKARWNTSEKTKSLKWWEDFFKHIKKSDFLMGKTNKPFSCGFDWIVKKANFVKIIEGNYHGKSL